jgi:DNA-binding MarR family transcriptional regulator
VDALDLIILGRELSKIGERGLRGGTPSATTNGRALVLRDVFANPQSPVSAIVERTGLPQSYVSESIAALRDDGILQTAPDPSDRRRTLATISASHRTRVAARASTPVDAVLAEELGERRARRVLPLLERLAALLSADQPGRVVTALRPPARSQPAEPA